MSDPTAYFHNFKLADICRSYPEWKIEAEVPQFRPSTYGERAHAYYTGASASFEVLMRLAFIRGHEGAETPTEFWRRVRAWQVGLITVLGRSFGPLSIVRDPDGTQWGEKDSTTSNGTIAGGGVGTLTLDDTPTGWEVGDYVLLVDKLTPTTTYETTAILLVAGNDINLNPTNSYTDESQVHRLNWHFPLATPVEFPNLPTDGDIDSDEYLEFEMRFRSTDDPVESVYA